MAGVRDKQPVAGARIERATLKTKAIELSLQGLSLRRIADELGTTKSDVHRMLTEALEAAEPDPERVNLERERQIERHHRYLEHWIPLSLEEPGVQVNPTTGEATVTVQCIKDAAMVVAKYEERLAKLGGLDAPVRTSADVHTTADLAARAPDELLSILRDELNARPEFKAELLAEYLAEQPKKEGE